MFDLALKTLLSYLLGSISGSLLIGRLRGGIDIRTMGSGNAGGTNALRTQGGWFAFWTMVVDVGKGVVATAFVPTLQIETSSADSLAHILNRDWLAVICATSAVIGHVYPVWHEFRGGKGAATLVGALIGLHPIALVPVFSVWLAIVAMSGFVGLATILAATTFPVYLVLTDYTNSALLIFGIAMTLFVSFTHRGNIRRMLDGTEHRVNRLWLLRPR